MTTPSFVFAALVAILPTNEQRVVNEVAAQYRLTEDQRALLCAIRRTENGAPHLTWGVADRSCRTFHQQARWAANTIRKRYNGDISAFARRWCPHDSRNWARNVRFFIRKQKAT